MASTSSAEELATVQALIESEAVYQKETVQGVARKLGYKLVDHRLELYAVPLDDKKS